jgi:hypothetical protein
MYFSSQLKWHERAWFAISVILNAISLSSFLDEVLAWPSWISDALAWYRSIVAMVLTSSGLIPHFTPPMVVSTVSQLLVFMGGVFASANFYALRTEGQSVFRRVYDTSCRGERFPWLCAFRKTITLYILGPALLPLVLWKAVVGRAPTQRSLGFTFRPSHVAACYLSLIGTVAVTLALASYFYAHSERQAQRRLGVASWQENRMRS